MASQCQASLTVVGSRPSQSARIDYHEPFALGRQGESLVERDEGECLGMLLSGHDGGCQLERIARPQRVDAEEAHCGVA